VLPAQRLERLQSGRKIEERDGNAPHIESSHTNGLRREQSAQQPSRLTRRLAAFQRDQDSHRLGFHVARFMEVNL
jgi:hypothetical protein